MIGRHQALRGRIELLTTTHRKSGWFGVSGLFRLRGLSIRHTHTVYTSRCALEPSRNTLSQTGRPSKPLLTPPLPPVVGSRERAPFFCVILSLFSFSSFFSPRSRGVRALQLRALFLHTQLIVLTTRALLHRFIPRLLQHQTSRLGPFKRDGRHVLTFSTHTHTQATNPTSFFRRRQ